MPICPSSPTNVAAVAMACPLHSFKYSRISYEPPPLFVIFKMSLDSGTCPKLWKLADITPIYKKGDASQPANYRPISIIPAVCRLFERLPVDDKHDNLHNHQLMTDAQYGFVRRRFTEIQLLNCSDDWTKDVDCKRFAHIVYIDFSKAFDTVSHEKLLHKLTKYGISGNIQWFTSFLNNRKQRVKLGNSYSSYANVIYGVPQGSCTGPLLFILYANELPDYQQATNIKVSIFADGTKCSMTFSNPLDRVHMQTRLDSFTRWADRWQLQIAEHKCCVLAIGKSEQPSYHMNGARLVNVNNYCDIVVIVDNNCLFRNHVSSICQKAYVTINVLFRCFHTANANDLVLGYTYFVRPVLEYCSNVWNPFIHAIHYIDRRAGQGTTLLYSPIILPLPPPLQSWLRAQYHCTQT